MKLIQLLQLFDFDDVWEPLTDIYDVEEDLKSKYEKAHGLLLGLTPEDNDAYERICVESESDSKQDLFCYIKNRFYTPPPSGYEMWGGKEDDEGDIPEGRYYNINCSRYSESFAMIIPDWENYLNLEVVIEGEFSATQALAVILYEITFHGFSPQEIENFLDDLDEYKTFQHK